MATIVPIYSMIRKDLSQLLHNKSFMITCVVTILFNLLLPNILTFQVRNVNVAIVAHDRSQLSNNIIQDIVYTNDFRLAGMCATYEEALSLVNHGEADCIVEIPEHFERDMMQHDNTHIQVSINAINTTKAMAASQNLTGTIAATLSHYASNQAVTQKENVENVITTQNLYNPSFDYKLLMLPVMFIGVTLVFNIAVRLITNELQYGTIDQIYVSPMNRLAFMTSKLITCYIVSMVNILLSMASLWLVYGFIPQGNFILFLLALTLYVLCCSCTALLLCNLSSTASQMVLYSSIISLLAMMMSGYITPLECVAEWLQPLSYLLPTRYTIVILRNVALKSSDFYDLFAEFLPLALLTLVFYILSVVTCKKSRE